MVGFAPRDKEPTLGVKFISAGLGAATADILTFPLDTVKVRLQIQGEGGQKADPKAFKYRGIIGTALTISREEGPRCLYGGLVAGLQRQVCFSSVRIGLYDHVRKFYSKKLDVHEGAGLLALRILAGITTATVAVSIAQPTDVIKIRMQATPNRYKNCRTAYKRVALDEGVKGLWKGVGPNIARTVIVNVCEVVTYDIAKTTILEHHLMEDNLPCHFTSAFIAGLVTTVVASPVDVVKTRYMNSPSGTYKSVFGCAGKMFREGGPIAFYKGVFPSFVRLTSWNILMFVFYEQFMRGISGFNDKYM